MDNGLTETKASEMLTQLAFYAGWPSVFSAMPAFKGVFAKRAIGPATTRKHHILPEEPAGELLDVSEEMHCCRKFCNSGAIHHSVAFARFSCRRS